MTDPSHLRLVLAYLYPAASPFAHYRVDDAAPGGPAIVAWDADALGAQPTQAQLDASELPAVKQRKRQAIDRKTTEIVARGFTFGATGFGLEPQTQGDLAALYSYAGINGLTFPQPLTTADDGEYSAPDLPTFQSLCGTALATKKAVLDAGRSLKVQVNACTDVAAVAAITDTRS